MRNAYSGGTEPSSPVWSGPVGPILQELPVTNADYDPVDHSLPDQGAIPGKPSGNGSLGTMHRLLTTGPIRQIEPLTDPGVNTTPTEAQAFVTGLYHDFFNRDPDPGGLQAWLNYIAQGGSLQSVVQGFLGSQEYLTT